MIEWEGDLQTAIYAMTKIVKMLIKQKNNKIYKTVTNINILHATVERTTYLQLNFEINYEITISCKHKM